MAAQWYYSIRGKVMGPVSTQQVQKLVASGLLADGGKVREISSTNWQSPQDVPELVTEASAADSVRSAALDAVTQQRSREQKRYQQKPGSASRRGSGIRLEAIVGAMTQWVSDAIETVVLSPLAAVPGMVWKILGGIAICGLLVVAAVWGIHEWNWKDRAVSTVQTTWEEYTRLRDAGANEDDWDSFRATTLPQLAAAARATERHAAGADQNTLDLLRMSRDVLPRLIKKAPQQDDGLEQQYGQFAVRHSRRAQAATPAVGGNLSGTERLFIIVDGVIIAGVLLWFVRRRLMAA